MRGERKRANANEGASVNAVQTTSWLFSFTLPVAVEASCSRPRVCSGGSGVAEFTPAASVFKMPVVHLSHKRYGRVHVTNAQHEPENSSARYMRRECLFTTTPPCHRKINDAFEASSSSMSLPSLLPLIRPRRSRVFECVRRRTRSAESACLRQESAVRHSAKTKNGGGKPYPFEELRMSNMVGGRDRWPLPWLIITIN